MDSITHIAVIDTVHRVIADSVTLEALKISQEFYSTAFDKILAIFGIFIMIVLAPGIWNLCKSRKYKNESENAKKRILELENDFQKELSKFNEDLEKLKKKIKSMDNELHSIGNHEN